jgi:K+-transporting ATPase KdpF subunit
MNVIYWFAALIAAALSVYLIIALLEPEWFE